MGAYETKKVTLVFDIDEYGNITLSPNEGSLAGVQSIPEPHSHGETVEVNGISSIPLVSMKIEGMRVCCIPAGDKHYRV
jgi:hypothetical protein